MKKFFIGLCVCLCAVMLVGCEGATMLRTAYFSEITADGSKNYGVRVTFAEDKRLDGKGVDVQIKFNKKGQVTIWKENNEKFDYIVSEEEEWQSLTVIFAGHEGKSEKYNRYEDALTRTYMFSYNGQMEITLRAVVGDIEQNLEKSGELLVGSQPISDQFTLKIK